MLPHLLRHFYYLPVKLYLILKEGIHIIYRVNSQEPRVFMPIYMLSLLQVVIDLSVLITYLITWLKSYKLDLKAREIETHFLPCSQNLAYDVHIQDLEPESRS